MMPAFTCEPFHNLVQVNMVAHEGVSFNSRRQSQRLKTDFFANEDRWCRPLMVRTGPDGALWVVDMYRYMIEHPSGCQQTASPNFSRTTALARNAGESTASSPKASVRQRRCDSHR